MKYFLVMIIILISSCEIQKERKKVYLSIDEDYHPRKLPLLMDTVCPPYRMLADIKDTAAYVSYNFEKRKACYLRKPLTILLNDLELPVRGYHNIDAVGTSIVPETYLFFYDNSTRLHKVKARQQMVILLISWKNPLDFNLTQELFKHNPQWTSEAVNYYGGQMIGDVSVLYK